ncbi:unnamed protein product [Pleuronectes platessa]|uniref:Uncharacterized protein n=1 Tax=Pleuronectes platessa TaxID=8262 RepID=A0A9N7UDS5_PLEPL|nr:unnamed protein product [Pleuronectes platessa]
MTEFRGMLICSGIKPLYRSGTKDREANISTWRNAARTDETTIWSRGEVTLVWNWTVPRTPSALEASALLAWRHILGGSVIHVHTARGGSPGRRHENTKWETDSVWFLVLFSSSLAEMTRQISSGTPRSHVSQLIYDLVS